MATVCIRLCLHTKQYALFRTYQVGRRGHRNWRSSGQGATCPDSRQSQSAPPGPRVSPDVLYRSMTMYPLVVMSGSMSCGAGSMTFSSLPSPVACHWPGGTTTVVPLNVSTTVKTCTAISKLYSMFFFYY